MTRVVGVIAIICVTVASSLAGEGKSAIPAIMRILKSGRVKGPQLKTVVSLVGRRGNANDLAYLYDKVVEPLKAKNAYGPALRLQILKDLGVAATSRKVVPTGNRAALAKLIQSKAKNNAQLRLAAIRLAGAWKAKELAKAVGQVVASKASLQLRQTALDSLRRIDSQQAKALIVKLDSPGRPIADRAFAVSMLVNIDPKAAAKRAAQQLAAKQVGDPAQLIDAFLSRKGGSDLLAAALTKVKMRKDTAKLALRYMFSIGRSDVKLNEVLDRHAGIQGLGKPLTKAQVKQLAAAVLKKGDPVRGEAIFRRQDLSCMKCHSVSKAGGNVGPDLSAVGSSTPVDYLINSILFPSQAIKEQYQSMVVVTADGDIHTGIIIDKAGDQLVLRDAKGKEVSIPKDDIDEQQKGKSLMPKGLAKFLTDQELLDLVRFLSQLGKPGPFAVRSKMTIQRWRVLRELPDEIKAAIPDSANLKALVLQRTQSAWGAAYGRVAGHLPLDELKSKVLVIQGEIQATSGGDAQVQLNAIDGVTVWIGEKKVTLTSKPATVSLPAGRSPVTLRIDRSKRKSGTIRVEFIRPSGTTAQFVIVGGR